MVEELLKLKDMLDKGIITKEEFTAAKEELVSKNRSVPLQRKPVSKSGFAPNSRPMHAPPKSPPKVQCPKCGAIYNSNTNYCVVCGSSLSSNKSIKKFEGEKNNPKGAAGIAILVLTILLLLFFVRPIANSISNTRIDKKRISQLCDNYGLDVINIFYEIDLDNKEAKIVSTNFDSLAYEEMFSLQRELPSSFSYTYVQNEENYVVDAKNNSIEKNGHIVYKEKKNSYTTQAENKPASTPEKSVSSSSSSYSTYISDKEKEELYYVAKSFVKNHLLSPSKAKFALYYECDYGRGTGNVYNVVGWVESQNIYGATIRETWSCMMERNGDRVSLVMLDIGGNLYFE